MGFKNFEYFKRNLPSLLKSYKGKYIVIKSESVMGAYDSFDIAYDTALKTEELGTFIIQHCVPDDDVIVRVAWRSVMASQP